MRLDIGCGPVPIEGYTSVDLHCDADIRGDIRTLVLDGVEEARLSHVLEHLPRFDVVPTLVNIRTWMRPGAPFVVEVPDMQAINAMDASDPMWVQYAYGSQQHDGEFHRCGFTERSLRVALGASGWKVEGSRRFLSDHPNRRRMPCVETTARA